MCSGCPQLPFDLRFEIELGSLLGGGWWGVGQRSEGRECGVGSVVVGFRVFGAPRFSVQRSPNYLFSSVLGLSVGYSGAPQKQRNPTTTDPPPPVLILILQVSLIELDNLESKIRSEKLTRSNLKGFQAGTFKRQIWPFLRQFSLSRKSHMPERRKALGVKFPGPFFSPKPPALTSINRRKSAINPEIASINVY